MAVVADAPANGGHVADNFWIGTREFAGADCPFPGEVGSCDEPPVAMKSPAEMRQMTINRRTLVLHKTETGWKIVHLHASEVSRADTQPKATGSR
jgi:hypothetical protein